MCVGTGETACQHLNVLACAYSTFPTKRLSWQNFDLFHLYLTRVLLLSASDKKKREREKKIIYLTGKAISSLLVQRKSMKRTELS